MGTKIVHQGWLKKQKSKATVIGSNANLRWFTIECVVKKKSSSACDDNQKIHLEKEEWTLCYYKTNISKEKVGWLFLADVNSVHQDENGQWITIVHPSKTYKLKAPNHTEHKKWFEILSKYSKSIRNDQEKIKTKNENNLDVSNHLTGMQVEKTDDCKELLAEKCTTELNFLRELTGKGSLQTNSQDLNSKERTKVHDNHDKFEGKNDHMLLSNCNVPIECHQLQQEVSEKVESTVVYKEAHKPTKPISLVRCPLEVLDDTISFKSDNQPSKTNIKKNNERLDKRFNVSGQMNVDETINKRIVRAITKSSEDTIQIEEMSICSAETEDSEKDTKVYISNDAKVCESKPQKPNNDTIIYSSHVHSGTLQLTQNNHRYLKTNLQLEDESSDDLGNSIENTGFSNFQNSSDSTYCHRKSLPISRMDKEKSPKNHQGCYDEVTTGTIFAAGSNYRKRDQESDIDNIHHQLQRSERQCIHHESKINHNEKVEWGCPADIYDDANADPDFATRNWDSDSICSDHSKVSEATKVSSKISAEDCFNKKINGLFMHAHFIEKDDICAEPDDNFLVEWDEET